MDVTVDMRTSINDVTVDIRTGFSLLQALPGSAHTIFPFRGTDK